MSQQEPFTPSEREVAAGGADTEETAPVAQYAETYEPIDEPGDWLEQPEQLPRRPRRRLLGKGGNPVAVALLGILLAACGFIGGVLVEKGEASSSTSTSAAASFASRFRDLAGGSGTSSSSTGGSSALPGGFTRPTAGTVATVEGSTLYVTNAEGNTVKVTTSRGTSVSKSVKSSVNAIHPGESVTITGSTASNGAVSAESISVGSSGSGLAALFGGAGGGGGSGAGSAGSSSGKEPALFGNGG